MTDSNRFSIYNRLKSFRFALNGLKNLVIKEHNARVHFVALLCVVVLGIYFDIKYCLSSIERVVSVICI